MVEDGEPIRYGGSSDIKRGGFWLTWLSRILARIRRCRDSRESPQLDLVKKSAHRSLTEVWSRRECLSMGSYTYPSGTELFIAPGKRTRKAPTIATAKGVGFEAHLQWRMDRQVLRISKTIWGKIRFKYLKNINRYFSSWILKWFYTFGRQYNCLVSSHIQMLILS